MRKIAFLLLFLSTSVHAAGPFHLGGPATTDNDSSCDVAVLPAATLLLPYFEVDLISPPGHGETTIFTVTNTSHLPQAVLVTLWTDRDYPVIAFHIYLTGYDVQSINLYDVIKRGQIATPGGTGFNVSPVGELSGTSKTDEFDNPVLNERSCGNLPGAIPQALVTRMQSVLTTGKIPASGATAACNTAGSVHQNAIGYATIDVVGGCATQIPTDYAYYAEVIRFENVLGGDYMQVNGNQDSAQGSAMVHIRAIPEGGTPRTRIENPDYRVNFERTFYSRYQHPATPKRDARQPLPATFAARWIAGGGGSFETLYKIWREGRSTASTPCSAFPERALMNFVEAVRFDEEENPQTAAPDIIVCAPITTRPFLPVATMISADNEHVFPPNTDDAVAGWMYLNLDYCNRDDFAGQNWVISSMRAEGRYSVDIDALALGNGCTAPIVTSEAYGGVERIGPAPNVRP